MRRLEIWWQSQSSPFHLWSAKDCCPSPVISRKMWWFCNIHTYIRPIKRIICSLFLPLSVCPAHLESGSNQKSNNGTCLMPPGMPRGIQPVDEPCQTDPDNKPVYSCELSQLGFKVLVFCRTTPQVPPLKGTSQCKDGIPEQIVASYQIVAVLQHQGWKMNMLVTKLPVKIMNCYAQCKPQAVP